MLQQESLPTKLLDLTQKCFSELVHEKAPEQGLTI
jgi:hypothetical protein